MPDTRFAGAGGRSTTNASLSSVADRALIRSNAPIQPRATLSRTAVQNAAEALPHISPLAGMKTVNLAIGRKKQE
jgi:hypothetical protein